MSFGVSRGVRETRAGPAIFAEILHKIDRGLARTSSGFGSLDG